MIHNPTLIEVLDELVSQGFVTRINFTGAGVVASVAGGLATVTISGGGGGGGSATTVEVDLGATPVSRGKFTIVDAGITGTSKVVIAQAPGPYTGKGSRADEAELDPLWCVAEPGTGQATVYWSTMPMYAPIPQGLTGGDGGAASSIASVAGRRSEHDPILLKRFGKVKGNVKFTYQVFA